MALPQICPKLKARVVMSDNAAYVSWGPQIIALFPRLSPAKTFAKRLNSMYRWLGQCTWVDNTAFTEVLAEKLIQAESGDGRYRPPLNAL